MSSRTTQKRSSGFVAPLTKVSPRRTYGLGLRTAEGQGGAQDYVTAHMWLTLARAQNHENARRARDHIRREE